MIEVSKINFKKGNGLIPAIIQDARTNRVLMLGFMNEEALVLTLDRKRVTFYSRSKERLWTKGETSGNFLNVEALLIDCDNDTLLIKVTPTGNVCHTGADTCFNETNNLFDLRDVEQIIQERKHSLKEDSYTSELFNSGLNKIAQKVGEEAVELVIEAKDNNRTLFLNEAADLMFHYLVLLAEKGQTLEDVVDVLHARHRR